jgi:hypothetical protein
MNATYLRCGECGRPVQRGYHCQDFHEEAHVELSMGVERAYLYMEDMLEHYRGKLPPIVDNAYWPGVETGQVVQARELYERWGAPPERAIPYDRPAGNSLFGGGT